MSLLELEKLTVRFGGLTAVEDVDTRVEHGRIFSIIGPNGAGKTTVFNVISGIYDPTSGHVKFRGRELIRPFTWRVGLAAMLVGLVTGLVAGLLALNVDALWRATIKRNYAGPGATFSYRAAWDDAGNYLDGKLALEPIRGGRWAVRTADGRRTLGFAKTREAAERSRENFNRLIDAGRRYSDGASDPIRQQNDRWVIASDGLALATFNSESDARSLLDKYARLSNDPVARKRDSLLALFSGMVLGTAGTLAVWSRARRSPEVIARAGVARTFQNIRLFQNMTVLDNVLTAMDRRIRGGVIRMALRTAGIRRHERDAREYAQELLVFVGLADQQHMLAKNLPYGDQRRLEIARALATRPDLVLLDEPAAGMNPAESLELNDLIQEIRARGPAVMLIEHHMNVVMGISDRIAVLEYGRKIAEGTPDEIRNDPKVIAAYLGDEEVT